jgi:hypothetical protein
MEKYGIGVRQIEMPFSPMPTRSCRWLGARLQVGDSGPVELRGAGLGLALLSVLPAY